MSEKLIAGDEECIVLIPCEEILGIPQLIGDTIVPFTAPTVAVINKWLNNANTTTLSAGGNISGAVKDDAKLEQAASDTDKDRSIISTGDAESPTFYNFDAQLNGFRDADLSAKGYYNLFNDLVKVPDVPYVIAHRLGYSHDTPAAVGQDWTLYYVWTDVSIPGYTDGGNQTTGQTFIAKNQILPLFTLTA